MRDPDCVKVHKNTTYDDAKHIKTLIHKAALEDIYT